jgi:hypothetical protein
MTPPIYGYANMYTTAAWYYFKLYRLIKKNVEKVQCVTAHPTYIILEQNLSIAASSKK